MELLIVFLFILIAGFFAGSETAFISINRVHLHAKLKEKSRRAKTVEFLLKRQEDTIGMFLFGTNIFIVAATILFTATLGKWIPTVWVPLITNLYLTPLALLFSDVLPKMVFRKFANTLFYKLSFLYLLIFIIFYPFQFIILRFIRLVLSLFGLNRKKKGMFSRNEFQHLLDITARKGELHHREKEFIKSIMNFRNIKSREIMVPLIRMVCVDENQSVVQAADIMLSSQHTRLPVYHLRIDNIIGYVENKDLIDAPAEPSIKNFTKPTLFVPECMSIDQLLIQMEEHSAQMVFVVDEYGGVTGVITPQDIITEIVGEFVEMNAGELIQKTKDSYRVKGTLDIDELNEELHINIEKDNFETVAGFVLNTLSKLPKTGESFTVGKYIFEVVERKDHRIETIEIYPKNKKRKP